MDERFKALRIIWLALVVGAATWATVAFCLVVLGFMAEGILAPSVLRIVATAAIAVMAAGMLVRRRMIEGIPRGAGAEERSAKYQVAVIVGLALIEGGGLLLVAVGMVAAAPGWVLAGGIATVLAMALARPTRDEAGLTGPGR